jgi:hypothetical protein
MWRIIRAEVSYHRYIFLAFLALMPGLVLHEMAGPVERVHPGVLIWVLVFLPVNFWVSLRSKDKRELQYTQLPIPAVEIGAARIIVVLVSGLVSAALYMVLHLLVAPSAPLHIKAFLVSTAVVVFIYSVVFIVSDRLVGNRRLSDAKIWITIIMGFMVLANLLLLVGTRSARRSGGEPPAVFKALSYFFKHHPFSTNVHTTVTVCVVLALALLSVFSFTRRRTQFS